MSEVKPQTTEENMEQASVRDITSDEVLQQKFKADFLADVAAARERHAIMNFSYLQYKGILALNAAYGKEYLETIGLQVNVPRTFMTIETLRAHLSNRPLIIGTKARNKSGMMNKNKAKYVLKGEWDRSKAHNEKNDAEFDAFLFGTGYLLSLFCDDTIITDVYAGADEEGKMKTEKAELTRYKGMKVRRINPYQIFRDRNATTNTPGQPGTWGHCYIYSIWDFDDWKEECKQRGFKTEGMVKGGTLEEFDAVRRRIDTLYTSSNNAFGTQQTTEDGQKIQAPTSITKADWSNKIMVVERLEPNSYTVMSGENWTINHKGLNPNPDKTIPIQVFRDYRVPDEFEGIGEPEAMRWQQYTENKVHNLAYLQVLMNTVQRYGLIEEYLKDPTEARNSNPLKPIRLKNIPNLKVNDAIQALNQGRGTQYPKDFLEEVKNIGQSATGVTDYLVGANEGQADTLGEANLMTGAGSQRITAKIQEMEERDLVPLLEHWLACIPQYYTEEMDILLNDNGPEEYYVKYVPYIRKYNTDSNTVAKLSIKNGQWGARTIEEVYLMAGYKDVVFVDDIIQGYDIFIKTVTYEAERQRTIAEFERAVMIMERVNTTRIAQGLPPQWDIAKLSEEILNQFPEIIKNVDDYKIAVPAPQPPMVDSAGEPPMGGGGAMPMSFATVPPTGQETFPINQPASM